MNVNEQHERIEAMWDLQARIGETRRFAPAEPSEETQRVDHILSLCTGIGGLDLGLAAGLRSVGRTPRTVCMVEREAYCCAVLGKQMQAGRLDQCPIWCGDIRDFPVDALAGVDWVCAGYPCQPFSQAGKQAGQDDPRHLWPVIRQQIGTLRPAGVFLENVAGHIRIGLRNVLEDLERLGYWCAWGLYTAEEVGAPHRRERVFILALADSDRSGRTQQRVTVAARPQSVAAKRRGWPSRPGRRQQPDEPSRTIEPGMGRNADGLPCRVDRLRALGNAVVPQQAEHAFKRLWGILHETVL